MSALTYLNKQKARCKEGETPAQHERHREALERAYAAFAAQQEDSRAASGTTQLTASVVVQAGVND